MQDLYYSLKELFKPVKMVYRSYKCGFLSLTPVLRVHLLAFFGSSSERSRALSPRALFDAGDGVLREPLASLEVAGVQPAALGEPLGEAVVA